MSKKYTKEQRAKDIEKLHETISTHLQLSEDDLPKVTETVIYINDKPTKYYIRTDGMVFRREIKKGEIVDNVMYGGLDSDGYHNVTLSVDGEKKTFKIHRLVANAFIPNREMLPEVNHKDGNKLNNTIDNLEWVTTEDNIKHSYETGLQKHRVYTDKQINLVCVLLTTNLYSLKDISKLTDVTVDMIRRVIRGERHYGIAKHYDLTKYNPHDHFEVKYGIHTIPEKETILEIMDDIQNSDSTIIEIAHKHNVSEGLVSNLKNGKTHKNLLKAYDILVEAA